MGATAGSAPARLYYDPSCGPCTFFARVNEWASRAHVRALPYDGKEASRELAGMSDALRFSYAHLVDPWGRRSGSEIMVPLLGLTFGGAAERTASQVPAIDRALRWIYDRFWNYRRTRGCAAGSAPVLS